MWPSDSAPGQRRDLADQRAQKRRLAAAVRADQADALAAPHQHIAHPHAQSRAAAILVADSQLIGRQRDLAGLDLRAHAELDRRVHRRALDALQAVELLLAATRLFAALPSLVATDELLGMRDVLLLRLVLAAPSAPSARRATPRSACSRRDTTRRAGGRSR